MPAPFVRIPATASLTTALLIVGCASGTTHARSHEPAPAGGLLITAERIAHSGARTAWDVLKREAPMLTLRENRKGQAASMGRRGQASIYLKETLLITVDGARVSDYEVLQSMAAETIFSIYIITGIEGTTYYGTNAVGGVIEIRTKDGSES